MKKFFHIENANRNVQAGGRSFRFSPYEMTACWLGVHASESEAEIADLTALAAKPTSGIKEITEEQYDQAIKKKRSASQSYASSLANTTPTPGEATVPSAAGQPVEPNLDAEPVEAPAPLETVGEAIEVVPVQPRTK